MKHIKDFYPVIRENEPKTVAVAGAGDQAVLTAVREAHKCGMIQGQLYGNQKQITELLISIHENPEDYEIFHAESDEDAAKQAAQSVSEGKADILMKGFLSSAVFIRAVLHKEYGLRKPGRILSAMSVTEIRIENNDRLLFIADPGFIPLPTLEEKKEIIVNSVEALHILGIDNPRVAVLSAMETVNPKILSSREAHELEEMWKRGEISGCVVGGPFSLDLALSEKSAKHKQFKHPIAGKADMLLVPSIEVGNALLKSLTFIMEAPAGGIVTGVTKPVVFTSRSDTPETKQNTIAIAVLMAERMKNGEW